MKVGLEAKVQDSQSQAKLAEDMEVTRRHKGMVTTHYVIKYVEGAVLDIPIFLVIQVRFVVERFMAKQVKYVKVITMHTENLIRKVKYCQQ